MSALKKVIAIVFVVCICLQLLLSGCSFGADLLNYLVKDIETIKDSVVMIEVYDKNRELLGTGSGFAAYYSDWIVTNMHVIEGGRYLYVITDDGYKHVVKEIILFNKRDDLAILRFDGKLEPLTIGDTNRLKVKDKVTAIGSPKGELNTVSEGIISNIDVENVIRISAPISHGSSGGVLLNENYEVIGITNAGYDNAQNLNFAIDVSLLESMYEDYKDKKYVALNTQNYTDFLPCVSSSNLRRGLEISEKMYLSNKYNYSVDSFDSFYKATNKYEIFTSSIKWFLKRKGVKFGALYKRYLDMTEKEQREVAEYYTYLLELESENMNESVRNIAWEEIENWEKEEYILRLNLLSAYELAVFVIDVDGDELSENSVIQYMNDNNLSYEAKIIIYKLLFESDNTYNSEIVDMFDKNDDIDYNQMVALLEYLDMTVDEEGIVRWN